MNFEQKGSLAKIWLAAHFERKLTKSQLIQTNISTSVGKFTTLSRFLESIVTRQTPLALRLSGQLLLGIVRIYSKKAKYLLEDCNEAILRIKMSFKSGHVNLAPEHITAHVNAITLADSMTAFDMLLPEPLLAELLVMHKSIPSTPSQSFRTTQLETLSLPNQTPSQFMLESMIQQDPLDSLEKSMEVEVGRDANPNQEYRRDSILPDSLLPEKSFQENPTFERDEDPVLAFDVNPPSSAFGDAPEDEDDVSMNLSFDFQEPSKPTTPIQPHFSFKMNSSKSSKMGGSSVDSTPTKKTKAHRKRRAADSSGRSKILLDTCIELPADQATANVSQITKKPKLLIESRIVYEMLQKSQNPSFLKSLHDSFPRGMNSLLEYKNISLEVKHAAPVAKPSKETTAFSEGLNSDFMDAVSLQNDFLAEPADFGDMDDHRPATPLDDFSLTFNQDLDQENMISTPKAPHSHSLVFPSPMQPPLIDSASKSELSMTTLESSQAEKLAGSSLIAISLLKDKLENVGDSVSLKDLSQSMGKRDNVKLFFETLVLASRNLIKVKQTDAFGDIVLTTKESLYSPDFE